MLHQLQRLYVARVSHDPSVGEAPYPSQRAHFDSWRRNRQAGECVNRQVAVALDVRVQGPRVRRVEQLLQLLEGGPEALLQQRTRGTSKGGNVRLHTDASLMDSRAYPFSFIHLFLVQS